jgi:hypothetical protein
LGDALEDVFAVDEAVGFLAGKTELTQLLKTLKIDDIEKKLVHDLLTEDEDDEDWDDDEDEDAVDDEEKKDISEVENYLLGKSNIEPQKLPLVDIPFGYFSEVRAALISVVSPVTERICMYLFHQNLFPQRTWRKPYYRFFTILSYMSEIFGNETAGKFFDALSLSTDEKLATIIKYYDFQHFYIKDKEKKWLKYEIFRTAGDNTELLEDAFKPPSIDVREFILEAMLEAMLENKTDYKPQWLIDFFSNSSKRIRDRAVSILLPQKQLKDLIEPLAQNKKKPVRECAEKLLKGYALAEGREI